MREGLRGEATEIQGGQTNSAQQTQPNLRLCLVRAGWTTCSNYVLELGARTRCSYNVVVPLRRVDTRYSHSSRSEPRTASRMLHSEKPFRPFPVTVPPMNPPTSAPTMPMSIV